MELNCRSDQKRKVLPWLPQCHCYKLKSTIWWCYFLFWYMLTVRPSCNIHFKQCCHIFDGNGLDTERTDFTETTCWNGNVKQIYLNNSIISFTIILLMCIKKFPLFFLIILVYYYYLFILKRTGVEIKEAWNLN